MNILTQLCSKLNLMKSTGSQNSFDSSPIAAHFEIVPIADHKIDSKKIVNFLWQNFKNDKINAFVMPYSVMINLKSSVGLANVLASDPRHAWSVRNTVRARPRFSSFHGPGPVPEFKFFLGPGLAGSGERLSGLPRLRNSKWSCDLWNFMFSGENYNFRVFKGFSKVFYGF